MPVMHLFQDVVSTKRIYVCLDHKCEHHRILLLKEMVSISSGQETESASGENEETLMKRLLDRGVGKAKGLEHPGTCNSWESLPLLIAQESSAVRGRCPAGAVSMRGHSPAINTSYSPGGVGKKCQNPLSSSDPHWYPTQ